MVVLGLLIVDPAVAKLAPYEKFVANELRYASKYGWPSVSAINIHQNNNFLYIQYAARSKIKDMNWCIDAAYTCIIKGIL